MRVYVYDTDEDRCLDLIFTLAHELIEAIRAPALQDLCSALYRDPETALVFVQKEPTAAYLACRDFRIAGVRNVILALIAPAHDPFMPQTAASFRARILMAGADDVQTMPIDDRELVARVRALIRRERQEAAEIEIAGCLFNPSTGMFVGAFGGVHLTKREGDILALLASCNGVVVTKERIFNEIFAGPDEPAPKIVDVYICKLRRKLFGVLDRRDVIETVWGRGYRYEKNGFVPAFSTAREARAAG